MNYKKGMTMRCVGCGKLNVVQGKMRDGHNCSLCGSSLRPIEECFIITNNKNDLKLKCTVDTKEIDIVIEKLQEIERLKENIRSINIY